MSSAVPDKKSVRLNIFNQTYSLLVTGDPADMEHAADEVDELMTTIARAGNVDATRIAVLACLHLQDRIHTLERELRSMQGHAEDVQAKTRRLSELLETIE
jgi:cell division protein ZapA